jgi:hypothetical protein
MRTLSIFAVMLVALSGSRASDKIAPVPKETEPKFSIDGKYNLMSISTPDDRAGPGGGFGGAIGGAGGGGPVAKGMRVSSAVLLGAATITKNEITLEGSGRINPITGLGGQTTMEYTLDTTKTPAFIDVDVISLRGKKSKSLGLVEVHGNRLIIALAKEGDERPKSTEEAEGVTVYYFQKAPRTEYRIVALTVGKEEATEKELNKLAQEGFELVTTTQPTATDAKSSVTTVHFLLRRTVK